MQQQAVRQNLWQKSTLLQDNLFHKTLAADCAPERANNVLGCAE